MKRIYQTAAEIKRGKVCVSKPMKHGSQLHMFSEIIKNGEEIPRKYLEEKFGKNKIYGLKEQLRTVYGCDINITKEYVKLNAIWDGKEYVSIDKINMLDE